MSIFQIISFMSIFQIIFFRLLGRYDILLLVNHLMSIFQIIYFYMLVMVHLKVDFLHFHVIVIKTDIVQDQVSPIQLVDFMMFLYRLCTKKKGKKSIPYLILCNEHKNNNQRMNMLCGLTLDVDLQGSITYINIQQSFFFL